MNNKSIFLFIAGLAFFLSVFQSCQDSRAPKEASDTATAITADSSAPFWGVYTDTLPCADCGGIVTKLFLDKDFTYIKEENYLGAPDTQQHIFYDLGKWKLKDSTISLTAQLAGSNNGYRLLENGALQMLGENGQQMPDSIRDQYNLQPAGKIFTPRKAFLVSGVLDRSETVATLRICIWDKEMKLLLAKQAQAQLDSLWKNLKSPDGKKAIIQAEVLPDPHEAGQMIATKVSGVIDGDSCN